MNPLKSLCRLLATFARPFWGWAPEEAQDGREGGTEATESATGKETASSDVFNDHPDPKIAPEGYTQREWDELQARAYRRVRAMVDEYRIRKMVADGVEKELNAARRDVAQNRKGRR